MKHVGFVFLFFFALQIPAHSNSPLPCSPMPITIPTRWGGNELVQIDKRDRPVRGVHGVVELADAPADGALVQVFKRDHSDPLYNQKVRETNLPIAACVVGSKGAFSFSLPAGEYELRASMNKGVCVTSVFLTVSHGWHRSRKIFVVMAMGS